jgi:hypothetical protein
MRRYAGDAGPSWRKFGDPEIHYAPIWRRYPFGFWAFCTLAGIVAGLFVAAAAH